MKKILMSPFVIGLLFILSVNMNASLALAADNPIHVICTSCDKDKDCDKKCKKGKKSKCCKKKSEKTGDAKKSCAKKGDSKKCCSKSKTSAKESSEAEVK